MIIVILAGLNFTHILDFMIMMPLGPQLTQAFAISDAKFGLLVSAYTFAAGASGLLASLYIDRFERRRLLLGACRQIGIAGGDFLRRRLGTVGTMHDVLVDRLREVGTDRARRRLVRPGRPVDRPDHADRRQEVAFGPCSTRPPISCT